MFSNTERANNGRCRELLDHIMHNNKNADVQKNRQKVLMDTNSNRNRSMLQYDITSGGDADRMLHSLPLHSPQDEHLRRRCKRDKFSSKNLPSNIKCTDQDLNLKLEPPLNRYQSARVPNNNIGEQNCLYGNDSKLRDLGDCSEYSVKSQQSNKTIVSRKSTLDLRKLVTSQCKLHEVIGETLKEMSNTDADNRIDQESELQRDSIAHYPVTVSPCKRCAERVHTVQSQKDVMTATGKDALLDCRNTNRLTLYVDDVINSRVVYPMINKLHRMYFNNLKEEMSLMEDLELLPNKVNEVYNSIIFKQKN